MKGSVLGPSSGPPVGVTGIPGAVDDVDELSGSPALVTEEGRVVVVLRGAGCTVVEDVDVEEVEDDVEVLLASVVLALTMLVLVVDDEEVELDDELVDEVVVVGGPPHPLMLTFLSLLIVLATNCPDKSVPSPRSM